MKCPMCGGEKFEDPKGLAGASLGWFGGVYGCRCMKCNFVAFFKGMNEAWAALYPELNQQNDADAAINSGQETQDAVETLDEWDADLLDD